MSSPSALTLLVATRKGAWLYHGDAERKTWRVDGPHFLGHVISHLVLDPRDGRTLLAAARTGHLGPTLFRSTDFGRTWSEAARPPAFAKVEGGAGRSVDHTFWLTPGHASQPGVWYAGTSPQGLFRSEDGGDTWAPCSSINDDPQYLKWMGTAQDGTPDGPKLHSIIVDPRDPSHMYMAMSGGGAHESFDAGRSFAPLIEGLEVVEGFDVTQPTFHDPHCIRLCPANPDRLYQQNHCGISTGSTGRPRAGGASAVACRPRSAISVSLWWCTRAIRTPPGCSRWTAPPCGRAPARAGSRRYSSPAMVVSNGSVRTPACRSNRPGGR